MEVRLAEHAGFCFGVKRAVDTVYEQLATGKTIYTYGPIVHNEEVVRELEERGVRVLEADGVPDCVPGNPVVVIRAHGIPRDTYERLSNSGYACIDATCPFVKRIHRIVSEESRKGRHIIIAGNPNHPEVEGIRGWCEGPATVVESPEQAEAFTAAEGEKLAVVAQTTFNYKKFDYIVEIFKKKGYNIYIANTICNATEERQQSARALAAEADVMIVIGGKHSSNTQKLYEICREECDRTYFVQKLEDLHLELPETVRMVGITAGASTPDKIIEEVQKNVRINF